MSHDEARVDVALLDMVEQWTQVAMPVALPGANRERAVDHRAHWEVVDQTTVDADDRNRATVAAAANRLPQCERTIRLNFQQLFRAIERVERSVSMRFETDRVDAGVGATTTSELEQSFVHVRS